MKSLTLQTAAMIVALSSMAAADQIVELYGTSLTSYLYTGTTAVQGIRPLFTQRGVFLDGTLREAPGLGWAVAGDPLSAGGSNSWDGSRRMAGLDLATGAYAPTFVNLALPAPRGGQWVVGVSYNGVQDSSGHLDSNGYQGRNWMQISQPEIRLFTGASADLDVLYLNYGASGFIEFQRTAATGGGALVFKAKNGAAGVVVYSNPGGGAPDTYTYTDQRGNQAVFFGGTNSSPASWQLWKTQGESGNVAYVGDATTAATAISSGYDANGRVLLAYDAADSGGRRYSYTYTTLDSVKRLTQVKAEVKTGGTWASPSGVSTVGTVDYAYYQTGDNTYGDNGCLKLITVTTPLSPGSTNLVEKTYFRYWKSGDTGYIASNLLKLVVGPAGYAKRDWDNNGALDDDPQSATTANLEPYSDAYLEYASNYKIDTAFFNGQCGCGGGSSAGTHTFTYDDSSGKATAIANSTYDTAWATRTVVAQPDGTYFTQYFDEVGAPITRVVTAGDPAAGSPPDRWVTEVVRSSWDGTNHLGGAVTEVRTPEANNTYTHNTMGSPDGSVAAKSGTGLITVYTRPTSGDMRGMATQSLHKKGTSGTAFFNADFAYGSATQTLGTVILTRPFIDTSNRYVTEVSTVHTGTYNSTTWSRTFWTLMEKDVTQTDPAVSTGNNGPNAGTTRSMYFNADGTLAFTKSPTGIIGYRGYDGKGLVSMAVEDTNTASGDLTGVSIPSSPTNYATSGTALHRKTTMTYDAQARPDETTLPDGRVTKTSYTKLKDGRRVVLSTPKYVSGSTTSYSPLSYAVSNLAGGTEFNATVAFSAGTTTTAMTSLVSATSGSDPIASLGTGTITRLSTSIYSPDGHRVDESRQYSVVPGSGAGSSGTNYDATLYGYDAMNRKVRSVDPTGTISRTELDALGRQIAAWVGTNDNSFGALTGGSSDMTKTRTIQYDGGSANKNSRLTLLSVDPDGLWVNDGSPGNPIDNRDTGYTYDYRGRMLLQTNPDAPHVLMSYDNLGRVIATGKYADTSSIVLGASDPTSDATDRLALSETAYDEMGRAFRTTRHSIDVSDGSDDESIARDSWFDPEGRLMKQMGDGVHRKMQYDRVGRQIGVYTLASDDDTTYADASASTGIWDSTNLVTRIAGDKVLEETHTVYEASSGNVLFSTSVQRNVGDTSTTGTLDSGADNDPTTVTATDITGRIQISAMWYDSLDRMTDSASYGTNGGSTFTRGGSAPTRSASVMRTTTTYDDDGSVLQAEGPGLPGDLSTTSGVKTRYTYDAAGRTLSVINNYVDGTPGNGGGNIDDDQKVTYTYTNGLKTAMTAVMPSGGTNQVTTYLYGTVKGTPSQMKVSTGNRLRAVKYPDSTNPGTTAAYIDGTSDADVVSFAYDAQGMESYKKDQNASVIETDYDYHGRVTQKRVTTVGSGVDSAVRRIATTYTTRGETLKVSQYDNATVGSGSLVDDVKYTYTGYGDVDTFAQDPDSNLDSGASGVPSFSVSYTYTKATPSGGSTNIRRTAMSYGGASLTYEYSSSSSLDDVASRVTDVKISTTKIATYSYLGANQVVFTTLNEALTQLFAGWDGSAYHLDTFNRISTSSVKAKNKIADVDLSYDWVGNIIAAVDNLHKTGGNRSFDVKYSLDNLSRLLRAEEGTYSAGSISNRSRDERWGDTSTPVVSKLDQAGNILWHQLDVNGNGTFTDAGDEQQTADTSYNAVNETGSRTFKLSNASTTYTNTYDGNGNTTDDGQSYTYVWDAWNRLRQVKTRGMSPVLVAEYRYNGLNYRISWKYDNDRSGGGTPDGTVDGNDHTFYLGYTERWQNVSTRRDSDSNLKELLVYHSAGLGGRAGSSYIDDVMFRDRDANTAWRSSADGVLEERRYDCQDWRHDVSAVVTDTSKIVESAKYSSYGVAFGIPAGDTNCDGAWDSTDSGALGGGTTTDPGKDPNQDGTSDSADATWANSITGSAQTLGRGILSSTAVTNRKGYAGYELDPTFTLNGNARSIAHVRNRAYFPERGVWASRDPEGYKNGSSLYNCLWMDFASHQNAAGSCCNSPGCARDPQSFAVRMASLIINRLRSPSMDAIPARPRLLDTNCLRNPNMQQAVLYTCCYELYNDPGTGIPCPGTSHGGQQILTCDGQVVSKTSICFGCYGQCRPPSVGETMACETQVLTIDLPGGEMGHCTLTAPLCTCPVWP